MTVWMSFCHVLLSLYFGLKMTSIFLLIIDHQFFLPLRDTVMSWCRVLCLSSCCIQIEYIDNKGSENSDDDDQMVIWSVEIDLPAFTAKRKEEFDAVVRVNKEEVKDKMCGDADAEGEECFFCVMSLILLGRDTPFHESLSSSYFLHLRRWRWDGRCIKTKIPWDSRKHPRKNLRWPIVVLTSRY